MSFKSTTEATAKDPMERRVIRLDGLYDPAGIAAALRRAFEERPVARLFGDDDPFDALLKQIH